MNNKNEKHALRIALMREKASRTRYWAWYVSVETAYIEHGCSTRWHQKLTAAVNWREVGCGDEALNVRRFGIGRSQERAECYTTLRKAIGSG